MRCTALDSVPLLYRGMVGILAALLLLTAATLALPTSKHSWTETPWDGELAEEDGTKATTLSLPLAFNLSGAETPSLYIGGHVLNLSEYLPCQFSCQLWIRKGTQWSHYLEAARGEEVDVILYMPRYGNVDLYLISYAGGTQDHWNFKLLEGYHLLRLRIEEEGRHFMMAAQKNEPGNSLILDVVSRADTATTSPLDLSLAPIGKAKVTVRSERMRGYDVYLDGVFYSSDIGDGSIDGIASFTVGGDKTHTITVSQRDIQGNIINVSEHTRIFKRDVAYTLLIE
ncbi:hypothetical protein [Methanothrix sp.]|uniref:hypothetical protein n=1 Tax=Methanothrix sp. TaxID=90426 RepID=UPI003C73A68A